MNEDAVPESPAVPSAAARVAGQHARATKRRYARNAILTVTALLSVLLVGITVFGLGWCNVALEAAVIGAILYVEKTAAPRISRWARGARGEELVGAVLDELQDEGWYALHDVPFDKGNIDHVVVGPAAGVQ